MKLTITIQMDNAAFEEPGFEVARMLRQLAGRLEEWPGANKFTIGLRDINGNKVGECFTTGKATPYQPKTGQPCHCKLGQQRDNCPDCEATGMRIDFAAIRKAKVSR